MKDKEAKRAFEPISDGISDGAIWSRMTARARQPDFWAARWAAYPRLLVVRDIMSRMIVSYCSVCPNHYFLPDDDIQVFLYYADAIDSIDLAELFADVEAMFGIELPEKLSRCRDAYDAYDALISCKVSSLPYYALLNHLLEFISPENGLDEVAAKAFEPITNKTLAKYIRPMLEVRAQWPDLWAAQWPDEPKLLGARDRVGRLLMLCSKKYWPNYFFLPGDSMEVLIWKEADSLDLVEIVMEIEERLNIKIDDATIPHLFSSQLNYLGFLNKLLQMSDPDKDLADHDYKWEPFSLPPEYYRRSLWGTISRRFPIFCDSRDGMWHDQLRTDQAFRPVTWEDQWPRDDKLIQLRNRVGRILVEHLQWLDGAFIPQDCLEAVFHSREGLRRIIRVLKIINNEFKCDVPLEFVISGEHTFEDFLKEIDRGAENPGDGN